MIHELLVSSLLVVGTFFILVGSIGLIRMPDLYCRMHAASKCITMGISGLLLASIAELGTGEIAIKAILAIVFQFVTTPVSAHMIARAAYHHLDVAFWKGTFLHEWNEGLKSDRDD